MTEERLVLAELLEKAGEGDFLRAVAEAVLQLLMESDVEGMIGAGRYERSGERTTWRNGYRERTLDTRLGAGIGFVSFTLCDGVVATRAPRPTNHRGTEVTMAQNIAIERVDHIGVRVRNLDRALGFYRVLGFAVVRRAEGDDVAIIRNEHGVELNLVFNA